MLPARTQEPLTRENLAATKEPRAEAVITAETGRTHHRSMRRQKRDHASAASGEIVHKTSLADEIDDLIAVAVDGLDPPQLAEGNGIGPPGGAMTGRVNLLLEDRQRIVRIRFT